MVIVHKLHLAQPYVDVSLASRAVFVKEQLILVRESRVVIGERVSRKLMEIMIASAKVYFFYYRRLFLIHINQFFFLFVILLH